MLPYWIIPRDEGDRMSEAAIRLHIEPLAEGGYVATSPDVPGLVAEGAPWPKWRRSPGMSRKIVESCREHGDPLPAARLASTTRSPLT